MIFRIVFFCLVLLPFLVIAIPLQFLISRLGLPLWNIIPRWFHMIACLFLGLRVKAYGEPLHGRPTLLLANHISWTDIIAIGSIADVTFVAKTGVRNTFFVGFMASLQRTLYVDYNRRQDAKRISTEMAQRLASNGAVLLFAEGHRDLGTHVQPFRSALVGAAQAAMQDGGASDVAIQPVTIAYTHLQGLPVSRADRAGISGMNLRGLKEVVTNLLTANVKNVAVAFGPPIPMASDSDRKDVTRRAEEHVRRTLVALNRGEPLPELAREYFG